MTSTSLATPAIVRFIARLLFALSLTSNCLIVAHAADLKAPTERRAVELTYLKSTPGSLENLKTFIVQNWFEMDKVAIAQGLMHTYSMLDSGSDDGAWNVLVMVTYRDERGYDGIVEPFEKIRRTHKVVTVDGKGLRDLGTIVESKKVYESLK